MSGEGIKGSGDRKRIIGLIILAYVAFVALGMPDGLLGVGWPSIRAGFELPLDAIGMFLAAVVAGYMVSSFSSGFLLARMGVGRMLAASCLLTGTALIGYTLVPAWWMMVSLGVIAGLGAGAIDAGLNTYVAAHFSEGLMQWLHACWGVGITTGPVIMTLGLTAFGAWRFGYRIVGGFQIALAACFVFTLALWDRSDGKAGAASGGSAASAEPAASGGSAASAEPAEKKLTDYKTPMLETLRKPRVWLSMLLFFLYVGAEGGLGIWTYSLLTEARGVDKAVAGFFTGSYWLTFTMGRFLAGIIARRTGPDKLVMGGLVGALVGAGLLVWNPFTAANVIAVAIIGISIAPIFPAMTSGTRARVGERYAANTIGMQMAVAGFATAFVPSLMGVLARRVSLEAIPYCLLAIYFVLLCVYAAASRPRKA